MHIEIESIMFEAAHTAFKRHMFDMSKGELFTGFQHKFFVNDEVKYKWRAYNKAEQALCLAQWEHWVKTPGLIIKAVQEACKPVVSENLLEHKYGFENSSEAALYRVSTPEEISGLERQLFSFFGGGSASPLEFGPRFDAFAQYLRDNHLGCNWAFLAYLAFLMRPQSYFPIRPSRFDALLEYYGVNQAISGHVSWERYSLLMDVAEALKAKLVLYGRPDAVEIQSYMWVVAYLVEQQKISPLTNVFPELDFDSELQARTRKAGERERIGLLGEQFVFEHEKSQLDSAGRVDLANKVRVVSAENDFGYDILSYTVDGREAHIEVKTTVSSQAQDFGFWLTDNERKLAEQDEQWMIYRVWSIDTLPVCFKLGNIVREPSSDWALTVSNWFVNRTSA